MQTSSRLALAALLALPMAVACSSSPSTTGSTSEANSISSNKPPYTEDGGPNGELCCASVNAGPNGAAPDCDIDFDCCSGHCGSSNVCVCAPSGGYCATDADCCNGACSTVRDGRGLGKCP